MTSLLNADDWFHGLEALTRNTERVCRTHELTTDGQAFATRHAAVAVLAIESCVLSVLSDDRRLTIIVSILLHALELFA